MTHVYKWKPQIWADQCELWFVLWFSSRTGYFCHISYFLVHTLTYQARKSIFVSAHMCLPFGAGAMAGCDIRARLVVGCEVLTRQSSGYMHLTLTSVHLLRATKW